MNNVSVNLQKIVQGKNILSYAKQTGLRSMQNIPSGAEREIIEAYRNELKHEVWGNPNKLAEWVNKKFSELRDKNYISHKINDTETINERNEAVKVWADIINGNTICKNNPFIKLKVLRSVVENLKEDNMQFPPVINKNVFERAIYEVKKYGLSFKKTYCKLFKQFNSMPEVVTDEISQNGIRGTWYSISIPDSASASRQPGTFKKIKEFISILSQDSNWCTRNTKAINNDFMGIDFHVFVDNKGYPQLCIAGSDKYGGRFKYIKGNDQYSPIQDKYKPLLKSFLELKKLDKAIVGETDVTMKPVLDICK